jgi:hypothetical protein
VNVREKYYIEEENDKWEENNDGEIRILPDVLGSESCCEHCNELSNFIKHVQFHDN